MQLLQCEGAGDTVVQWFVLLSDRKQVGRVVWCPPAA